MGERQLAHCRDGAVRRRWLAELCEFLAFPSVSASPARQSDLESCADWLAGHLQHLGLDNPAVLPGLDGAAPSVYADWLRAPGQPTLLLYGHFDVQPADPTGWHTPPFQPTLIGGRIYARGASDDKGQLFAHLKALETWLATERRLPINVKVWLEGEEEINSPHLSVFLDREGRRLHSDVALVSDTEMPSPKQPSIVLGLRGNATIELEVRGSSRDLHSGRYGGAVDNPVEVLSRILAGLHTRDGHVAVPGFYRRVKNWSAEARRRLGANSLSDEAFLAGVGMPCAAGEPGFTTFERATIRPALTVTGVQSGYTSGDKSVIPARALARLSVRMVADQEPSQVAQLVMDRIHQLTPGSVRTRTRVNSLSHPVDMSASHPAFAAAERAVRRVWGVRPVYTRNGGSISAVAALRRRQRIPIVVLGLGLPSDAIHAANEHLHLSQLFRGIATVTQFLEELRQ
jgi:acetylornithine deacetylase/succinyl-diaminopimelate desuccinylase-like protein